MARNWFASGCGRPAIFAGFANAGIPIGIDVSDTSARVLGMAAAYTRRGGRVFVDSGAFTAFTKGRVVDFDEVFDRYDRLVAEGSPRNLFLVLPDRIGDQSASLELLRAWSTRIRSLISAGANCLVPIQKGSRTMAEYWKLATDLLGTDELVASIPSKAAAVSPEEAIGFVAEARPSRVHMLGIGQGTPAKRARIADLEALGASVTTDSNKLRANVGQGRAITELRRRLIERGKAVGSAATTMAISLFESGLGSVEAAA